MKRLEDAPVTIISLVSVAGVAIFANLVMAVVTSV